MRLILAILLILIAAGAAVPARAAVVAFGCPAEALPGGVSQNGGGITDTVTCWGSYEGSAQPAIAVENGTIVSVTETRGTDLTALAVTIRANAAGRMVVRFGDWVGVVRVIDVWAGQRHFLPAVDR